MCYYRTDDGKCRKFTDDKYTSYCVDGPCPDDTPTNADRIRGAQDKEIARELLAMYLHGHCDCNEENGFCVTEQGLIEWLQQPAETEGAE